MNTLRFKKGTAAFVYGLHSGDGAFRYIGKTTCTPSARLAQHVCDSRTRRNSAVSEWIRGQLSNGKRPVVRVLEVCEPSLGAERERAYIAAFRGIGAALLNMTDGGDGAPGCERSAETRAKMSKVNSGRVCSPETKARIAASHIGIRPGPQTRAKISAALRGRPGNWLGRKHSEESRAKMSASRIGNRNSAGRTDARGRKYSPETIERMREARRRYWERRRAGEAKEFRAGVTNESGAAVKARSGDSRNIPGPIHTRSEER